jgi:hypothetical protein
VGNFFHSLAMASPAGLVLHVNKFALELVNMPPHNYAETFLAKFSDF